MSAPFTFRLPEELAAKEPPERRGLSRDRALNKVTHTRFDSQSFSNLMANNECRRKYRALLESKIS